ncbi:uncharacterized protein LOC135197247 [Macrobrachium nipponense]|uniref:uncharacterized protein LOC135197247 n=1 Tax=Macrobrachium nipponense TaxID=159736 RepID=UPI0030C89AAB
MASLRRFVPFVLPLWIGFFLIAASTQVNAQGYGGGNPAPANTATTLGYNDTMYNESVVLPESAFEGVWVLTPAPVNVVVLVPSARVGRRRHGVVIIIINTGNEYTGCCLQGWRYKHGCLISVLELFFICRDGTWIHITLETQVRMIVDGKLLLGKIEENASSVSPTVPLISG